MISHEKLETGPTPREWGTAWSRIMTHTHHMQSAGLSLEETNRELITWCGKHDIDAVGVGSPWEPMSSEGFKRFEGVERDAYYGGRHGGHGVSSLPNGLS